MKRPIFVRELTDDERQALEESLRSSEAFVLRRAQILLASARGKWVPQIAEDLGCNPQTVRNAIHDFHDRGLKALQRRPPIPHTTHPAFDAEGLERLREVLHQSPRDYGKEASVWTLALVAEVSHAQGLTDQVVSYETIRSALKRLGKRWQRAKRWIQSPDPEYARKKGRRDRLIALAQAHPDWMVGFQDETWWSRVRPPTVSTWADEGQPARLVEQTVPRGEQKALACYGLLLSARYRADGEHDEVWLRFVDGRPVSATTTAFLAWCCERLAARGVRVWVLIWDNAAWHISREVKHWLHAHNRMVKRSGEGVRILPCSLPVKSPWLNPLEVYWRHGKRQTTEPDGVLTAEELEARICAYYGCDQEAHLAIPQKVA